MNKLVNVGVIGAGAFMSKQHLPNIMRNPGICLHTICDLSEDTLAQRKKEFGPLNISTNTDDVLKNDEIDAVLVGTRSSHHAFFIEKAAECGKHVYVEKPMTSSYEETERVLSVMKGTDTLVGVGFNRRYAPAMIEAKEIFQKSKEGPSNIVYRIVDDHEVRPKYIFNMEDGGGHLLQEGCHIFDLIAWFLEEEPVSVYAAGPLETDNIVILKFADDSLATIICGGKGGLFYPKELMEVFCNRTTIAIDTFYELRVDGMAKSLCKRYPLDPKSDVTLTENTMSGFYDASLGQRPENDKDISIDDLRDKVGLKVDKGHAEALTAFAEALTDNKPYGMTYIDGARASVCALKAYDSIRENRPVEIKPEEYGL
ncbi:MAG: Gfo/Idh/MocA family protein [Planctomycetota bacterium]|jgi:predicted dehydrogenase